MLDGQGFFSAQDSDPLESVMAMRRDVRGNLFTNKNVDDATLDRIIDAGYR